MIKWSLSIIVILLFTSLSIAQSKQELELQSKFWGIPNKDKSVTEVPQKWANESAVILYKEESFTYTNNGKKMYSPSFNHSRVILLDKAAVEIYSEFKYQKDSHERLGGFGNYSDKETIVGIKIIKPDGSETILDIENESIAQDDEFKIAIPGLEVGDVLDIFINEDDYLRSFSGTHLYDPVEKLLSVSHPILYQKLSVEVENDYFLNMESYNGAPEIFEEPTDRKATKKYSLEVRDTEKSEFPRWFYPFVELPVVKFQVVFALKFTNETYAGAFLGEDEAERKALVTMPEVKEYFAPRFHADSRKKVKDVLKYLEAEGITDKREQMVKALYYIRHMSYNRFLELVVALENLVTGSYTMPCDEDVVILNENKFVTYMAGLAKQLEIPYDIVVATAAYNGSVEELLLRSNVAYGLRFNFEKPLYFFELSAHAQANYFPSELEGTKIYTISVKKNKSLDEISLDRLPITTFNDNIQIEKTKITLGGDFKSIQVNRSLSYAGHYKIEELSDRMFYDDYIQAENDKFGTKNFYDCRKKQSKSDKEVEDKMKSLASALRKRQEEKFQNQVNWGLEISDYDYKVIESSRFSNNPFLFEETFTVDDNLAKKAGSNYIIEVGRYIGGQVQIGEGERSRTKPVYLNFAKTLENYITIEIPSGYEVVGLDKLNKSVVNETGSFESSAKIEGTSLIISTKKIYAKKQYTASQWNLMTRWLDEAYAFSQEKIMFKKL